ncbi:MAG: hypothetical protein IPJ85_12445 [Flavobacteriales bacterium]|nr:hypothetical protein [Flavobacteriales bacterium]
MDGPVALCDDPGSDGPDVWYTFSTGTESTVRISLSPHGRYDRLGICHLHSLRRQ